MAEKTRALREQSLNDPLTGLRNRRFVGEVVMPEIGSFTSFKRTVMRFDARRRPEQAETVFALYMVDIDHFKTVNDTFGHETGDAVLKAMGTLLRSLIREDDFVIRWGGEEFLVILKRSEMAYVPVFADKMRAAVQRTPFFGTDSGRTAIRLAVSVGAACFPFYEDEPDYFTFEQTVMLADLALYWAKRHGRNRSVRLAPGAVRVPREQIVGSLSDLDAALAADYVRVVEQV